MTKFLNRLGMQGTYLNIIKAVHRKPKGNIKLNVENIKAINSTTMRNKTRLSLSPYLFNTVPELLARAMRK